MVYYILYPSKLGSISSSRKTQNITVFFSWLNWHFFYKNDYLFPDVKFETPNIFFISPKNQLTNGVMFFLGGAPINWPTKNGSNPGVVGPTSGGYHPPTLSDSLASKISNLVSGPIGCILGFFFLPRCYTWGIGDGLYYSFIWGLLKNIVKITMKQPGFNGK